MHIRHHKYSQLGDICGAGISDWVRNWLEKATAPHSSTFAYKIPWTEEPGRLQFMGLLELDTTERLHFHFSLSCIGEGNGNPLHCSCLENPRDGGAWWAAVYGVAQSRTRLKRLSSSSSSPNRCEVWLWFTFHQWLVMLSVFSDTHWLSSLERRLFRSSAIFKNLFLIGRWLL